MKNKTFQKGKFLSHSFLVLFIIVSLIILLTSNTATARNQPTKINPQSPASSNTNAGLITFSNKGQINTINPDGTGVTKVADGFSGILSPDGKKLAFIQRDDGLGASGGGSSKETIYILDFANGTKEATCTIDIQEAARLLNWSPAGDTIALTLFYLGSNNNTTNIDYVSFCDIKTKTLNQAFKTPVGIISHNFDWTPDGKSAIWQVSTDLYYGGIAKKGADAKDIGIGGAGNIIETAKISHDGKTIAIGFSDGIFFLSTPGQNSPLEGKTYATNPTNLAWSPDDQALAISQFNKNSQTYYYNITILDLTDPTLSKTKIIQNSIDDPKLSWEATANSNASTSSATPTQSVTLAPTPTTQTTASMDTIPSSVARLDATLSGHTENISGVSWSPNGKVLATNSTDNTIKLWSPQGNNLATLSSSGNKIYDMFWSSDSKSIVGELNDGTIQFWYADGKKGVAIQGQRLAKWSPNKNGQAIMTTVDIPNGETNLWDSDGQELNTINNLSPVWSPNGAYIATTQQNQVVLYTSSAAILKVGPSTQSNIYNLVWSPDNKKIAIVNQDGSIEIADPFTTQILYTVPSNNTGNPITVSWSPDSTELAVSTKTDVELWNISYKKQASKFNDAFSAQWSPTTNLLAVGFRNSTQLVDANGKVIASFPYSLNNLSWSPNGKIIAIVDNLGKVELWLANGQALGVLQNSHDSPSILPEWSPDSQFLAIPSDKIVELWKIDSTAASNIALPTALPTVTPTPTPPPAGINAPFIVLKHNERLSGFSPYWSPDSKEIVTITTDSTTVYLWDSAGNSLTTIRDFQNIRNGAYVVWSPDSKFFIIYADSDPLHPPKLYDNKGVLITTLSGQTGNINDVEWSPDSNSIVICSNDKTIKLWSVQGKLLQTLTFSANVSYAAWSPDNEHLVVVTDNEISLWKFSSANLTENKTLYSGNSEVESVLWSPNSKMLATQNGAALQIWDSSGNLMYQVQKSGNSRFNWSPDSQAFAVEINGAVHVYTAFDGSSVTVLGQESQASRVYFIQWSSDGKTILVIHAHDTQLWAAANSQLIATLPNVSASWSSDGKFIYGLSDTSTLSIWSSNGALLGSIPQINVGDHEPNIILSPDSKILSIVLDNDKNVYLWKISDILKLPIPPSVTPTPTVVEPIATPTVKTVNLPPYTNLVFSQEPSDLYAGSKFITQPIVMAMGNDNKPVTNFNGQIMLSLKSNAGNSAANLAGTTVITAKNGVATFNDLSIDLPGTGYILTAMSPDYPDTSITALSNPFNVSGPSSLLTDVPLFDNWEKDDLFHGATSIAASSQTLNIKVNIDRYYGQVVTSGVTAGRLIDYDCPINCYDIDKVRNQKLHDKIATLYLSVKNGSQFSTQNVTATVVSGNSNSLEAIPVTVQGISGVSNLIEVSIPVTYFYFPNVCLKPDGTPRNPCLRDLNNSNYSADSSKLAPDGEDTFANLKPVLNSITIYGLTETNSPLEVRNAVLFINGVRPVLLMSGVDIAPNPGEIKDTTSDWCSWIRWLGNFDTETVDSQNEDKCSDYSKDDYSGQGIPSWNVPRNGTQTAEDQQQYLLAGAKFLNRVYGAKQINVIAHSMGGVTSRMFTYESWQGTNGSPATVDKLITLDSPHTGVRGSAFYPSSLPSPPFPTNIYLQPIINWLNQQLQNLPDSAKSLGTDQMRDFNSKYNLSQIWGGDDEAKKHFFVTTTHGMYNCSSLDNCTDIGTDDGLVEDISATGEAYPQASPSDYLLHPTIIPDSNLPGLYATIQNPLPNVCNQDNLLLSYSLTYSSSFPYLTPNYFSSFLCHGWSLHQVSSVKKWVVDTAGIFDYCQNNLPDGLVPPLSSCNQSVSTNSSGNVQKGNSSLDVNSLTLLNAPLHEVLSAFLTAMLGKTNKAEICCTANFSNSSAYNVTAQSSNSITASSTITYSTQDLLFDTGSLSPSSVVTKTFSVDETSDVLVKILGSSTSLVQARIEDQSGTVLASNKQLPASFYFSNTSLKPGQYNLVLSSGNITTSLPYIIDVNAKSSLILASTIIPPTKGSGKFGNIRASLVNFSPTSTYSITSITATVAYLNTSGEVTTTNIILNPDNSLQTNGSYAIKNYSGDLPSPFISGTAVVGIMAKGYNSGYPFTRQIQDTTTARSGEIHFTGSYSWQQSSQGVLNAKSNIDTVFFDATVSVQHTGVYRIEVGVADANGNIVATKTSTRGFEVGESKFELNFNNFQNWGNQSSSGTYHLGWLELYTVTGNQSQKADEVDDLTTIPTLNLRTDQLFLPTTISAVKGSILDTPISVGNNSTKYQSLQIKVPISLSKTGVYSYSAVLASENHQLISGITGQITLVAGASVFVTLTFPSSDIAKSEQNGFYSLEDFTLIDTQSSETVLYSGLVGKTHQEYQFSSFENANAQTSQPFNFAPYLTILIAAIVMGGLIILFKRPKMKKP